MRTRQELGEALTAILRDPAPPGLRPQLEWFLPDDLPQLALHAARHRVAPFVARALHAARLTASAEATAQLDRTHAHWAAVHLMALEDLRTLGGVLGDADVPFLVVKGPVLAEHHYPAPDLRMYDDLDVVDDARGLRRGDRGSRGRRARARGPQLAADPRGGPRPAASPAAARHAGRRPLEPAEPRHGARRVRRADGGAGRQRPRGHDRGSR